MLALKAKKQEGNIKKSNTQKIADSDEDEDQEGMFWRNRRSLYGMSNAKTPVEFSHHHGHGEDAD